MQKLKNDHWPKCTGSYKKASNRTDLALAPVTQVQDLGVQVVYFRDDSVHKYIHKMIALPFLLKDLMLRSNFRAYVPPALRPGPRSTSQSASGLFEHQQVDSNTFPPVNWSVHWQPIRTNNDIEGWHNTLNWWSGGNAGCCFTSWLSFLTVKLHLLPSQSGWYLTIS